MRYFEKDMSKANQLRVEVRHKYSLYLNCFFKSNFQL